MNTLRTLSSRAAPLRTLGAVVPTHTHSPPPQLTTAANTQPHDINNDWKLPVNTTPSAHAMLHHQQYNATAALHHPVYTTPSLQHAHRSIDQPMNVNNSNEQYANVDTLISTLQQEASAIHMHALSLQHSLPSHDVTTLGLPTSSSSISVPLQCAVQKRRQSMRVRRNRRFGQRQKHAKRQYTFYRLCTNCGAPARPHHLCTHCFTLYDVRRCTGVNIPTHINVTTNSSPLA